MQEYIKILNGYRHAYGIADWTNAIVDPESGKQKPNYRWNYEEFTDTIYQEHLEGKVSVGIQPTNESGDSRFGVIDIDPKKYENFVDCKYNLDRIQEATYVDLTFRIRWDNDRLDLYRTNSREIFICDQENMSVYEHSEKKDPDWWMIVRNSIEFIECENEISVESID